MTTKLVKMDNRLHITPIVGSMEYEVSFFAEHNKIIKRSTIGNEDMHDLVEWLYRNTEHGYNVSEKIQKRVIDWVMGSIPNTTYCVVIDFQNQNGDLSRYYLMGLYGERVQFGGSAMKKLYTNSKSAINAAKRVREIYKNANVIVFETKLGEQSNMICKF